MIGKSMNERYADKKQSDKKTFVLEAKERHEVSQFFQNLVRIAKEGAIWSPSCGVYRISRKDKTFTLLRKEAPGFSERMSGIANMIEKNAVIIPEATGYSVIDETEEVQAKDEVSQ